MIRYTENLAVAGSERRLAVFALHPGMVRTELLDSYRSSPQMAAFLDGAPVDAYSPPELAAHVVSRIATGELDMLSGRFIDATADLDELRCAGQTALPPEALTLRLMPN
jgi:NAD(P)-dependent dehydrogenase (short-subunit alcohol dehydrogenase family)